MIEFDPDAFTVSWLRAYHATREGDAVERLAQHVDAGRLDGVALDPDFYDVQALRNAHVGRARRAPVALTARCHTDGTTEPFELRGSVEVHLLAHAAGYFVQRWTLRSDQCRADQPVDLGVLRALERGVWAGDADLTWRFEAGVPALRGNVRTAMNHLFLELHEQSRGRSVDADVLARWAVEGPHGCERIHQLCADNEISYPWPVTFGTQVEVVGAKFDDRTAAALATQVTVGADESARYEPRDIEDHADGVWWFWSENTAVVVRSSGTFDADLDCIDVDRTLLTEFLDLRRAALRSIQRDTQRIQTEGRPVTRRRIDEWRILLATTTDDYVLHDRIGALLVALNIHVADDPHLRDLRALENQARDNVESFQSRIDLAAQDASSIVGAIFAVVAAEPLAAMLRRLAVASGMNEALGTSDSALSRGFDLLFIGLAALVVWYLLRRSAHRLRGLRPEG